MEKPHLRPTFSVPLELGREEAIDRIREGFVARAELQGRWRGKGRWAELYVDESDKRIWSPHLSIRIDHGDSGSTLFGRFAPHPEIWTFVMFLYFAVAFLVLFGATFGYVQWASNEPAWGLWAVWLGLPFIASLHLASWIGQRLGQDQMRALQEVLWEVLGEMQDGAVDAGPGTG